jgi:hypothetical protein
MQREKLELPLVFALALQQQLAQLKQQRQQAAAAVDLGAAGGDNGDDGGSGGARCAAGERLACLHCLQASPLNKRPRGAPSSPLPLPLPAFATA